MQFGPYRHQGPTPRGLEGWLPPLVVGLASLLLVLALAYFVFVAYGMRERIPRLPPATIPAAMAAAALLAVFMLLRAVSQFRQAWRALREKEPHDS